MNQERACWASVFTSTPSPPSAPLHIHTHIHACTHTHTHAPVGLHCYVWLFSFPLSRRQNTTSDGTVQMSTFDRTAHRSPGEMKSPRLGFESQARSTGNIHSMATKNGKSLIRNIHIPPVMKWCTACCIYCPDLNPLCHTSPQRCFDQSLVMGVASKTQPFHKPREIALE